MLSRQTEPAGLITQRRLEGEHRNSSSADLMPVRLCGEFQRVAAIFQRIGHFQRRGRNAVFRLNALAQRAPFRPAEINALLHGSLADMTADLPRVGGRRLRFQQEEARVFVHQFFPVHLQGADSAGALVQHSPQAAVFQHQIVKQGGDAFAGLEIHRVFFSLMLPQHYRSVARRRYFRLHQKAEILVIPIFLQLSVHQLERQFPSCRIGHISPFQVADPIPAGQLHHFFPRQGKPPKFSTWKPPPAPSLWERGSFSLPPKALVSMFLQMACMARLIWD